MFICKGSKANGRLSITFEEAKAYSHASGANCDIFDPCDPYINLFINNKKVYQTRILFDQTNVYFGETYTSHVINRNASIRIEMWDHDLMSSPDLILSWDTNVDELLQKRIKYGTGKNKIVTSSSWLESFGSSNA